MQFLLGADEGDVDGVADVAGDGRAALVWTTLDAGRAATLSYLPLVPDVAPGALVEVADGCGRATSLQWGNSATHYLRDQADGVNDRRDLMF